MLGEGTPITVPEAINQEVMPDTFALDTIEGVTQLAGRLQDLPEEQRDLLGERIWNVLPDIEDTQLANELVDLSTRIMLFGSPKYRGLSNPEKAEEIEEEITENRKRDNNRRPDHRRSGEKLVNLSVMDATPTLEHLAKERPETPQSQFFAFLTDRIQAGVIPFRENGKPNVHAMNAAVKLLYHREQVLEQGITDTPSPEEAPRQPLTDAQIAYLHRFQRRVQSAVGHTDIQLPEENTMFQIIRTMNKNLQPPQEGTSATT